MKQVTEQPKRFLPNNCRPSYTGQGLTKKQLAFFKNPRTMKDIAEDLFRGDYWEANHFQNKMIADGVLEIHVNGSIGIINWA